MDDHNDVIDNIFVEAEDSFNDESTKSQVLELLSTAKIN